MIGRSEQGGANLSRRDFLRLGGAALGSLIASPWLQSCAPLLRDVELEESGLSLGCVVGDVRAEEALVWLRTREPAQVELHYSRDASFRDFLATSPVLASPERDLAVKIPLRDLAPGSRYFYRAAVARKAPGPVGEFVTAPAAGEATDVRFAFGGDTRQSFGPFSIMDAIAAKRPDFFVYLGDTIYADRDGAARRLPEFWAKYAANRDAPTRRLFERTCCYAVWDDHEVANDYRPGHPLAPIGWRAFLDYWPVREEAREPYRIYRSFRWGKAVELFLLDVRQYRDSRAETLLGAAQLAWLLERLAASDAYFKFIATAVPFSSLHRDKWGGFAKERDRILRFIERREIRNVIFVSADLHLAASARLPGGSGLREFVAGPLAAPMGIGIGLPRRCEFVFRDTFNYALVEVAAKAEPPYADVVHLDENNNELHRTRIKKA